MVTPANHVISWPDLHCAGPWYVVDYRNIFLPNTGEDQKKPYIQAWGPGTVLYGKSRSGYWITFMKRLDEVLR